MVHIVLSFCLFVCEGEHKRHGLVCVSFSLSPSPGSGALRSTVLGEAGRFGGGQEGEAAFLISGPWLAGFQHEQVS